MTAMLCRNVTAAHHTARTDLVEGVGERKDRGAGVDVAHGRRVVALSDGESAAAHDPATAAAVNLRVDARDLIQQCRCVPGVLPAVNRNTCAAVQPSRPGRPAGPG